MKACKQDKIRLGAVFSPPVCVISRKKDVYLSSQTNVLGALHFHYFINEAHASLCAALVMKFFFDKFNFTSGGALGSLTLGLVIKEIWSRGWPAFACTEGIYFTASSVFQHIHCQMRSIGCFS